MTTNTSTAGAGSNSWTTDVSCELLFIDPSVFDIETLVGNLRPGIEAIVLDGTQPASRQIAMALRNRGPLAAIHIIAHGSPGLVHFTAGDWSCETLEDEAQDFAAIERTIRGAEIRLWSCETAAGLDGNEFVKRLARATGAAVVAATGLVGSAAKAGRWELSCSHSPVRPPLTDVGVASYAGVLAAARIRVSGTIPDGATTGVTSYAVINRTTQAVIGRFRLPNAAHDVRAFRLLVNLEEQAGAYDAGVFDDAGRFHSSGFAIAAAGVPSDAIGVRSGP